MSVVCSIEGHAFAGKTTLINHAADTYGFHVIGEYDTYVNNTNEYPPHPHKSRDIAIQDVEFFAGLDEMREHDIKTYRKDDILTLCDRSFISLILFQKYTKYTKGDGEYDSYEYAKERYNHLVSSGKITLPDYMVYLQPASLDIHHSRLAREVSSNLLRHDGAYDFFNQEYKRVLTEYDKIDRLLVLNSENTKQNLKANAERILEFARVPLATEKHKLIDRIFQTL